VQVCDRAAYIEPLQTHHLNCSDYSTRGEPKHVEDFCASVVYIFQCM